MFSWKGKLIGALIGLIIGGPIGLIIGLIIGHLFDMGYFSKWLGGNTFHPNTTDVQKIFFDITFSIMGYLAKADGRVSEREIAITRHVMQQMNLNPDMQREAIRLFNLGKQPDFDLAGTIHQLRQSCWRHPSLLRTFLEIQLQVAYADGYLTSGKRAALQTICTQLGIAGFNFEQFEQQFRAGQEYQRHRHATVDSNQYLNDAYAVLGLSSTASEAEIKKAYRRLMSKHHPDKLMSQGLPPEMIKIATQKTQQIKNAYETIRKARGFS